MRLCLCVCTMVQTVVVLCLIIQHIHCAVVSNSELDIKTDDNFDWRNYGVITPVSDQGQLGSAMDFVIAEEVESLYAIKTKSKAILLSRNEVADCCDNPDTHQPIFDGFGCIVAIGGLCSNSTYKSHTGKCQSNTCTPIGKVTGTGYIPTGREDFMKKVIHITPIAAWIDASQSSFQVYTSGIYSDPSCSSTQLDHAVQIVGYGTEAGLDYWTVKNSWGAGWGEQGYMRIQRGQNMCGIATLAFYPIDK